MQKMKNTVLFLAFCITCLSSAGQVFVHEDFSDGGMPPDGWSVSSHAVNWSVSQTNNAGGEVPEARFTWSPSFVGESRLISPSIDLSGNESGMLVISFRHMLDHYGGPYTIGMAFRSRGGPWETLWSEVNPQGNIPASHIFVELDSDVVNSDDFQVSFFFSGNSFNLWDWYIDDIVVMAPLDFDLALSAIDVPVIFMGQVPVKGTVTNLGIETIDSFHLNWQLDDGEIHTTVIGGLELGLNDHYTFEAGDPIDAPPGSYALHVFVSDVNGQVVDDDPSNDAMVRQISVAHQSKDRRPLFEMFTSSTCPPCASFNHQFFNIFSSENAEHMVLIKYQMNWPGAGDPYYTAEGGVRRMYYGVTGVPSLFLEGHPVALNSGVIINGLQNAMQRPAYLEIDGTYDVDGDHIVIEGSLMPYADFPESRLHVVVIESATYGNVGTNGETVFHHVMHKMLPDAQGTTVNLPALEPHAFSHTFDMSTTNVEDMDRLMVAVFLQNNTSKEIYQSAYFHKYSVPVISFDFEDGATGVALDHVFTISSDQGLRHTDGTEITGESLQELINLYIDDSQGEHHPFSASINEEGTHITVTPIEMLMHNTLYRIELMPVMGVGGGITEAISIGFTTEDQTGITDEIIPGFVVYPNPASGTLFVETPDGKGIVRIFDLGGKLLGEQIIDGTPARIDLSGLRDGNYILEMTSGQKRAVRRISIMNP